MQNPEFRAKNQRQLDQAFTKNRFKGKIAVVVGGASGIGFAVAERFANDGASVAIVDIDKVTGEDAEKYLKSEGYDRVKYYYANVTEKALCEDVATEIAKENDGKIDFLVNGAVSFNTKALQSEMSDWRKSCDVNIYGTVAMVQACHPFMVKAGSGAIINVASISGKRAQPNRWTYSASKGAILTLTQNMALDLGKDNIRVNSVSPGWVWSPELAKSSSDGKLETILPAVKDFMILKRVAYTTEIAAVMVFLCSRDASFVTGTNVMVDGGYCAFGPEREDTDKLFKSVNEK